MIRHRRRVSSLSRGGTQVEALFAMVMLRDRGPLDRFPYLAGLSVNPDDAGRLDVAAGTADHGGLYIEASTGETRLLSEGDRIPEGTWVAQRDIDGLSVGPGMAEEPHGFGEGWGTQGEQLGGDRSYPEEDAGGTIRVPHDNRERVDPQDPAAFGSAPGTVTTAQARGTGTGSTGTGSEGEHA